jgi:penicillin-binding protein 2
MLFRKRKHTEYEIDPDEIFLDSSNLPNFNRDSLEGRLEKPLSKGSYIGVIVITFLVFGTLVAQAANLEIRKGKKYALQSEKNRLRSDVLFAQRGAILDRNGIPLVSNTVEENTNAVTRVYKTPGFSHLLGYVSYPKKDTSGKYYDTDIKGLAGVEASFNKTLAGENGKILVEEDAHGVMQSQGVVYPGKNGSALALSIDSRTQKAFHDSIAELADRIPFEGGSGILMNVETGEVHALVSYPEYDPNVLSKGSPADVISGYSTNKRQPYLDRAVSGLYTPGSIVKPLEASGALTDGIITPETTIVSKGFISIPNPYDPKKPTIFKDWKALGSLDLRHAIAWSSDVYFYTVGGGHDGRKGLGIDRLGYWYKTFGFTTPTGIELPREARGVIPSPEWKMETFKEEWTIGNTYHTAIGQYGMQVTPLEAARAIAAVANGGKLVKPTILKDAPLSGQSIPVSSEALKVVREGMRLGATEGTSLPLNDLTFTRIAGKTGTAELGFHKELYNSWAVGFFPYEHPKYVYVVVMEKGPAGNLVGAVSVVHEALSALNTTAPEYFNEQ